MQGGRAGKQAERKVGRQPSKQTADGQAGRKVARQASEQTSEQACMKARKQASGRA